MQDKTRHEADYIPLLIVLNVSLIVAVVRIIMTL